MIVSLIMSLKKEKCFICYSSSYFMLFPSVFLHLFSYYNSNRRLAYFNSCCHLPCILVSPILSCRKLESPGAYQIAKDPLTDPPNNVLATSFFFPPQYEIHARPNPIFPLSFFMLFPLPDHFFFHHQLL